MRRFVENLSKIKMCTLITILSVLLTQGIVSFIYFISKTPISIPGRISTLLSPLILAPIFSWWFVGLLFRIKKMEIEMRELATYDCLTQVYSRAAVFLALKNLLLVTKRTKTSLVLLYIDIDFFKKINDQFGHDAGDSVLINFGKSLKDGIRESDIVGRIGGEEFIVGLPDTNLDNGLLVAEKIRHGISREPIYKEIAITISIGVAVYNYTDSTTLDELVKSADKALYHAKMKGRNIVQN